MTRTNLSGLWLTRLPVTPSQQNQLSTKMAEHDTALDALDVRLGIVPDVVGDGVTDDTAAIQAALTAASTAGGGIVYLPKGTYYITDTLSMGSETRLVGDGIGNTVLRGKAGNYTGATAVATEQYATIAMIGKNHCSVEHLTVDHATNSTEANGIIMVPDGASGAGTYCTDCTVGNCEVLQYDTHQYGIWNQRGRRINILNNLVDGAVAALDTDSTQEGIESFGGHDVLIMGNTVRRVGNAGINITPAVGVASADLRGIQVIANRVDGCRQGIYLGTSYGATEGAQNLSDVVVSGNAIKDGWYYGILCKTPIAGTTLTNILICGNDVSDSKEGITVYGIDGETGHHGVVVSDNTIRGSTTTALGGLTAFYIANLRMSGNTVYGSAGTAIWVQGCIEPDIDGNTVDGCRYYAINCDSSPKGKITGNRCRRYSNLNDLRIGILVTGMASGVIYDNVMSQDYTHTDIAVDAASSDILLIRNHVLHSPTAASPFVNNCTSPRAS